MKINSILIFCFILVGTLNAQNTVEAEFDTIFNYQFEPLKTIHSKKVLVTEAHNTIYSLPYGKASAREMLRIMEADGFELVFTKQTLDSIHLAKSETNVLILHGMPNDKIVLNNGEKEETLYKSPLSNKEVIDIVKYVYNGGSLLLFLSHFPNGSGALPLLEAFQVKFRDGYAFHPNYLGHNGGLCSHFLMNDKNNLLKKEHPVFKDNLNLKTPMPNNVKFLCGAAVFRNPEDVILAFPNNTTNFTPTKNSDDVEEISDTYAGMIGFEYGAGRVVIATDQGMFRSLDLLIDDEKIPVTIHDPECDNAALFLNVLRWLAKIK